MQKPESLEMEVPSGPDKKQEWRSHREGQMRKAVNKIRKAARDDAFTLLEVLVAISILAVGLLAAASMQVAAIQGNFLAYSVTNGTTLAQHKMEDLTGLVYTEDFTDPDLSSGNHQDPTPPPGYAISWDVTNSNPMTNTKTITVTVTWQDKGVTRTAALTTIKAQQ
jgi:type IV pilus assembly protein PilV